MSLVLFRNFNSIEGFFWGESRVGELEFEVCSVRFYMLYILLDTRLNIKYGATSTTSCSLLFNDIGREMFLFILTLYLIFFISMACNCHVMLDTSYVMVSNPFQMYIYTVVVCNFITTFSFICAI